jgi:hypothetical protein
MEKRIERQTDKRVEGKRIRSGKFNDFGRFLGPFDLF